MIMMLSGNVGMGWMGGRRQRGRFVAQHVTIESCCKRVGRTAREEDSRAGLRRRKVPVCGRRTGCCILPRKGTYPMYAVLIVRPTQTYQAVILLILRPAS